jgi:hypothetical protein
MRDVRNWATALRCRFKREQRAHMPETIDQHQQAILELEALILGDGDTSERSGLLGRRYKALYEDTHDAEARSAFLNKAIFSFERAMMLDANDYLPPSNLPRLYRERRGDGDEKRAATAAEIARLAGERWRKRKPADPMVAPILLGAAFDAGDILRAEKLLGEMQAQAAPALDMLPANIPDLRRSLLLLNDARTSSALASVLAGLQRLLDPNGTVLALAGRRIDAGGAEERRFPPENETMVAVRIRNMMVSAASQAVVCSAASGADILALEGAGQLGLGRRVVLPFSVQQFRAASVADRGEGWGLRFDAILQQMQSEDILELNLQGGNNEAYATVNSKIIGEAVGWASTTGRRALAMVVWNGFSRGATDLTDEFRRVAVERILDVIPVPTL